eukprot:2601653-Pleurochrysis_carterae.AAC.1
MVPRIDSINWRSTLASCSGDITKWSRSLVVRLRTGPVDEVTLNKYEACYKPYYTSDPCYTKWQLVAIFRAFLWDVHKL